MTEAGAGSSRSLLLTSEPEQELVTGHRLVHCNATLPHTASQVHELELDYTKIYILWNTNDKCTASSTKGGHKLK